MYNAERMSALKRAYAEMILNTTKEAAARVVVSERKALGFQQDLKVAKEEALRMCLRLKHMLDLKTNEAATISIRQQKRIDELEAQLEEAEGIILDLREELKQVYDVLEMMKSCHPHHLKYNSPKNDASLTKTSANGGERINDSKTILPYPSGSEIETVTNSDANKPNNGIYQDCMKSNTGGETEQVEPSDLEDNYGKESDLAPILTRSKEPEPCKNGFTQRIWAFERKLVNGTLSVCEDVGHQYSHGKNNLNPIVNNNGKIIAPSKSKGMDKKKNLLTEKCRKFLKVHRQRRKSRLLKLKTFTGKSLHLSSRLMNSCKRSNIISINNIYSISGNLRSEKDDHHKMDEPNDMKDPHGMKGSSLHKKDCYQDDIGVIHKGKREQNMTGRNGTFNSFSSSLLMPCKIHSANADSKYDDDKSGMCVSDPRIKAVALVDSGLTLIKSQSDSGSTDAAENIELLDKSEALCCAEDKENGFTEVSGLVKHANDDAKSSADSKCELGCIMINECDDKMFSCQADKNQFLRYTRRKRNNESESSSDIKTDHGKGNLKRRAGEKDSEVPKPFKDKLTNESSCDQRRLAQVARQLISLSGKRC